MAHFKWGRNFLSFKGAGASIEKHYNSSFISTVTPAQIPQQERYQPGPELRNSNASAGNAAGAARPQSAARNQAQDSSPAPPTQYPTRPYYPNAEKHIKFRTIQREEEERAKDPLHIIPLDPETKAVTEELLTAIVPVLKQVEMLVLRWYLVTLDDVRARAFFRAVSYSLV
jgi:hypothetical protein